MKLWMEYNDMSGSPLVVSCVSYERTIGCHKMKTGWFTWLKKKTIKQRAMRQENPHTPIALPSCFPPQTWFLPVLSTSCASQSVGEFRMTNNSAIIFPCLAGDCISRNSRTDSTQMWTNGQFRKVRLSWLCHVYYKSRKCICIGY